MSYRDSETCRCACTSGACSCCSSSLRSPASCAERDAADRLVAALTIRSEETGAHIQRVGHFSAMLSRRAGTRPWTEEDVRLAAMLHDVGKIGIPDAILSKPGPLDEDEFGIIKRHPCGVATIVPVPSAAAAAASATLSSMDDGPSSMPGSR